MNRIDRLTAIIIYLQGRQRVTIDTLAHRYQISERTVYRDLRALQEAGVPIGSEQSKGYFIVEGYHLPPVMFDKKEAAALLAGERLMQKWSETQLSKSYVSALDKIRAVLHPRQKKYLEILDQHIKAFPYADEKNSGTTDFQIFGFLQDAIFKRQVIAIEYYSPYKNQFTQRNVEPLGLFLRGNHWYLAAWCRLRTSYRMFRIDRIEHFNLTTEQLPNHPEHTLKTFSKQSLQKEQDLQEVVVYFTQDMMRYLGDQKYYHGWVSEEATKQGVEMTFLTSSTEYFARWLLTWGQGVKVKKTDVLKQRVKELCEALHQHHCN